MSAAQDFQHQFYDMLMESQYWPKEVMLAYQRSQLEQLLRHAKSTVPFYENRLDAVFKRDGSIDWDRWTEIPILKRADVMRWREEMISQKPIAGHGPNGEMSTSGSTGHPITVEVTNLMVLDAGLPVAIAEMARGGLVEASRGEGDSRLQSPRWPQSRPMGPALGCGRKTRCFL
jgi:hypothetical protein